MQHSSSSYQKHCSPVCQLHALPTNKNIFVALPLLLLIKVLQILYLAPLNKMRPHASFLSCRGSSPRCKQTQSVCRAVRKWSASAHSSIGSSEESALWGSWSVLSISFHLTTHTHTHTFLPVFPSWWQVTDWTVFTMVYSVSTVPFHAHRHTHTLLCWIF